MKKKRNEEGGSARAKRTRSPIDRLIPTRRETGGEGEGGEGNAPVDTGGLPGIDGHESLAQHEREGDGIDPRRGGRRTASGTSETSMDEKMREKSWPSSHAKEPVPCDL